MSADFVNKPRLERLSKKVQNGISEPLIVKPMSKGWFIDDRLYIYIKRLMKGYSVLWLAWIANGDQWDNRVFAEQTKRKSKRKSKRYDFWFCCTCLLLVCPQTSKHPYGVGHGGEWLFLKP